MPSACSFIKANRLLKAQDYQRVFRSGHRFADGKFIVIVKKNPLHQARLGISITKKKIKKATQRNRIKRLIRESFRHNKNLLQGIDVIVLPQTEPFNFSNQVLVRSLSMLWDRVLRCKKL